MLVLNKNAPTIKLILTVYEINTVTTGSTLWLFDPYSNKTFSYQLPVDSSLYPERFNQFIVSGSTFSGLTIGSYNYSIKDGAGNVTETGMLKVTDNDYTVAETVAAEYVYITNGETDDDFIVYNK